MPAVPLGIGSYKRADGLVPEVVLKNLYLEKDKSGISPDQTLRIQRPGLAPLADMYAQIRGLHFRTSTGERLSVAGAALVSGTTSKGVIQGTGRAALVSTPFVTLIAADGVAYLYDTAVAALAVPNDAPSGGYVQDVDQLNGYGIVLLPNGRFYWLVPGETALDALNFATAESLPDKAVAVRRLGDEFWIFGTQNVEVWQATGDQDAPFQRASGRNFERGCIGRDAVRRFDNTLVWIGDDFQVYRASSVPQVISDPGISERIRKATGDCSAWVYGLDGHSFYVLTIPGQGAFAYDASTQAWSEYTWPVAFGYQEAGAIIAGSAIDGRLWNVDANATTDDGAAFERVITGTIPAFGKTFRNDSVSIGVGASADTTVRLRWKGGQDDYPAYYDEIDVRAPFDVAQMWRLGTPDQPYRTFEISIIAPERVRIAGFMANEGWA
ncbi:MAG TPA: hypothetical protein VF637_15310 [Sphingomicrobium sp.]|jgi:hypothetical protein